MAGVNGSFRQLEDKPCSSEIINMKWSPKMDLLALVTRDGEVWLNRLSWKRVWSISATTASRATCSAWRPDGKLIAVGFEDGSIKLFDIENAECIHTNKVTRQIVFMDWMEEVKSHSSEESEDRSLYEEKASVYLPALPQLPKAGGALFSKETTQFNSREDPKKLRSLEKELSVLIVADDVGQVHLYIYGIFHCGTVDTRSSLGTSGCGCQVISVCLSENLLSLSVIVKLDTDKPSADVTTLLVLYDTTLLASRNHELSVVAKKYGEIITLTEFFDETVRAMSDAWEDILLEMDTKLTEFATERNSAGSSVSTEFLTLLTRGVASPELQTFLIHGLTEKGLKKLGHSVENSYSSIQSLAVKHVECVTQALLYHVTELNGMAKWYDKFGVLGFEDTSIQSVIRSIGSLMLKTRELIQVIGTSLKSFEAFFQWLYSTILRLSDEKVPTFVKQFSQQDILLVVAFLEDQLAFDKQGKFTLERVGQYFEDKPLSVNFSSGASPWSRYVESVPELKASPFVITQESEASFTGLLKILKENLTVVFSNPGNVIGQSFLFKCAVPMCCCSDLNTGLPVISQTWSVSQASHLVAFTAGEKISEKLYLVSLKVVQTEQSPVIRAASVMLSQLGNSVPTEAVNISFKDAMFYNLETVSVLLEEERKESSEDEPVSVLAQISLSDINQNFLITFPVLDTIVNTAGLSCYDIAASVTQFKRLVGVQGRSLCVSGSRKVSCVMAESGRRIRLLDMDAEEEEEEEEEEEAEVDNDREKDKEDETTSVADSELHMSF